ncbi:PREDICTED: target of Nesh-SH3 isoform X8 [Gavialis gangeticus]|uniref:target of Nesh-SH3 isoform X8 n=1 Tax=Gavialis gangeticus TaxID=94835 RepID=UPI00092E8F81|nr:PREDICTED: target of Nesh-SH3 isoform X8 [Gavialis gangeticus]
MISRLFFLLFCGHVALNPGNAQKLPRVKRQGLKVQINTTGDTICMKYLRPNPNTKLEGFIVGYGSSFYSNQYIPLPADGKSYMTEVDAEPRYLIVVRPARTSNKKTCSGQTKMSKPLQLVVGTLTPSSVFLSWGILVNPHHDWTAMSNCASDRFYTVRYREKDKNKKWAFQLCPATETVVENLKPNTLYEFGVKDNTEDGIWSKSFNHKTVLSSKAISGQLQNTYKVVPNGQTQLTLRDPKNLVPVTIIKQVIQNITQRTSPKTTDRDRSSLPILVHLIIPGLNESLKKLPPALSIEDISQTVEKKLSKNETLLWPAESKTPEVQELSPQSLPGTSEPLQESIIPTVSGALEKSEASSAHSDSVLDSAKPSMTPKPELPLNKLAHSERASRLEETKLTSKPELAHTPTTLATSKLPELPKTKTSPPLRKPAGTLVFTDKQPVLSSPTTSDEPEISDPKPEKSELPLDSPTAKVSNLLKWPKATLAPNETSLVPSKLKPSATPEVQHVKPAPKPPLLEHSTPKTSRITDWPKTTLAPRETKFVPSTAKPTARPKMPRTRPAPSKAKPAPSKPKVTLQPEEPKTKPAATRESVPVPVTTKVSHTLEHPKATTASYEPQHTPSKSKASTSALPEMTYSEPESSETQFIPLTAKSSVEPKMPQSKAVLEPITLRTEPPRSAIAPKETQHVPSRPKPSPKPHIPQTKPVLDPITLRTERPRTAIAPKETRRVPSKPKATQSPEMLSTKPVLEPITFRTEKPKATLAPKDARRVYSKPSKTVPSPGVSPTKAGPKETRRVPLKPKTTPSPDVPQTKTVLASIAITTEQPKPTLALKETQYVPSKPKPSPTLDAPQTKPGFISNFFPAEIIPSLQEPVTTITPEQTKATLASSEKHLIPSKPKASAKPGMPQTKPAIHQTTLQPLVTKPSTTPEQSKATMAAKETRLVPSKPKTSLRPEGPQTKAAPKTTSFGSINLHLVHIVDGSKVTLVPNETAQTSFSPKTARTPENPLLKTASDVVHTGTSSPKIAKPFGKPEATLAPHKVQLPSERSKASDKPHSRPALSRTTPGPGRTKTPGILRWDAPTTDGLTEEDIVKFTGKDLGISWESSVSKKRPISEMLPPDPQHPLLAPAKPTQVRRKPLPPNTVTGKPGSPVNVLVPQVPPSPMATMARSAKPTNSVKTGAPRKSPTASATPEDFADATVFSSSPTSETDSLGKPRYTAPHVKYMKKEEDVPCSITSSLEYFPQEEGGSKEEPVQPPQNPPTNLTVVTVEGCPSFVILDWEKPDNDTVTEYEVVSTENGAPTGKEQSVITTNQTHSTVENLKPDTSYEFQVKPRNPLGEGPSSNTVAFNTESADPRVSEPISMGKDAIWTPVPFESDSYSECRGKQYVKRTWYKKFVGVQLCNSLRYKIYLSDSLTGKFYNIGDQRGHGEDHCQFVDSFLDGRTGQQVLPEQLPVRHGFFRAVRQEPVKFGEIGGQTHINYVHWYECGTSIPGKW